MNKEDILICPKCRCNLKREGSSFLCENKHCYDVAKEGYANLLLCDKKKTKDPGDDKLMISARNDFLNKGYFDKLRDLIELVVKEKSPTCLLDAGCGTGFYSHKLQDVCNVVVIDISKDAVKFTAKNNKKSLAVVASIFDMPLKDSSVDVILNVFAPKPQDEFARILNNNGVLIEVVPGKEHLKELKQKLFDTNVELNKEKFAFDKFELQSSKRLKYSVIIKTNQDLTNLLKMTPYFYKGGEKQLSRLNNIENFETTFDFIVNVWTKQHNNV